MALAHIDRSPPSFGLRPLRDGPESIVREETSWQKPAEPTVLANGALARISLARWSRSHLDGPMEVTTEHEDHSHFITYSMVQSEIDFSIGRTDVTAGVVVPRLVLLQGPTAARRRCIYHGPFDFFRVYLPQSLLAECYEAVYGRPLTQALVLFGACFTSDKVIGDLARSLIDVDDLGALGPCYVDTIGFALACRMLKHYAIPDSTPTRRAVVPLPKWRLNRVIDYIEGRLTAPIYLSDLSEVAGLSRMHFAAQFRAAVGCSPHAYIARRRIAFAQQMLIEQPLSIADVATTLGFASHAQFSSLFRKVAGVTPRQWRDNMMVQG